MLNFVYYEYEKNFMKISKNLTKKNDEKESVVWKNQSFFSFSKIKK